MTPFDAEICRNLAVVLILVGVALLVRDRLGGSD